MLPFSVLQNENFNPNNHLEEKDENPGLSCPVENYNINITSIWSGAVIFDFADTDVYSGNTNI